MELGPMRYNGSPLASSGRSADCQRVERTLTADEWRTKAEKLWELLDDIDTYFDMLKPEMEAFERMVNAKCQERHKELESDGYCLYPPNDGGEP
jgi:hypothetical protein